MKAYSSGNDFKVEDKIQYFGMCECLVVVDLHIVRKAHKKVLYSAGSGANSVLV